MATEQIQARTRKLVEAVERGLITSEECQLELDRIFLEVELERGSDELLVAGCEVGMDGPCNGGHHLRIPGPDKGPIPLEEALETVRKIAQSNPDSALNQ